ncbi:hypothetical protein PGT21_014054 [Puccinia graminis f. sp. tritici]|uniref:Uncharacterized protein n=1 Tax=Puccinia graminis f. sp. tritici TaxID=56615 RepID=A0A5B0QXD5_PUCGR|nr:hypothetical protein PGT21_014054 [Puccinia graminis f. sp. tritici]
MRWFSHSFTFLAMFHIYLPPTLHQSMKDPADIIKDVLGRRCHDCNRKYYIHRIEPQEMVCDARLSCRHGPYTGTCVGKKTVYIIKCNRFRCRSTRKIWHGCTKSKANDNYIYTHPLTECNLDIKLDSKIQLFKHEHTNM